MMHQTKQGKEFERHAKAIRTRIERQLLKHKYMAKGVPVDIHLNHEHPNRMPIIATVWDETGVIIMGNYYFYKNGQIKI